MQDEVVVPGVKVQGPEKVPVPLLLKVTVPAGADFVGASLSDTVTEHVVAWLIATDEGEQPVTLVVVVRLVTVNPKPVASALSAWTLSLAAYAALIVCVPPL